MTGICGIIKIQINYQNTTFVSHSLLLRGRKVRALLAIETFFLTEGCLSDSRATLFFRQKLPTFLPRFTFVVS